MRLDLQMCAFVDHPARDEVDATVEQLCALARELARVRATSAYLGGDTPTFADFLVAPARFYLELVEEGAPAPAEDSFGAWWRGMRETMPIVPRLPISRTGEITEAGYPE